MTLSPSWIGIDISKGWLDIADPACGAEVRLDNRATCIAAWAGPLAGRAVTVVFEATGVYDVALRRELAAAGIGHVRVNPQQARDFARACGRLAKTDRLDAAMLATMGQALGLRPDNPADPAREALARLNKRRDQLVAMRQMERTRYCEIDDPVIASGIEAHIAWLDRAIADVEAAIGAAIANTPELAMTAALLRTMPGIGPIAAATLSALMPELGWRTGKAIAMLAGLAPINADSGLRRGQRSIRGGRRRVRQALYMAAVSALRTKSVFKATYDRLRTAGKAPKVALIAIARKMLVALNAMVKTQTAFRT